MTRARPPRPADTTPARDPALPFGNGAEVYERNSRRLKGYIVNHAPGKNRCEAFDAKGASLGTGTQGECFGLLDTPRAVRVASDVFLESAPRKRKD